MYNFSVLDAFGILGVAFYIGAYAALQLGVLKGQGYLYALLNAVAAGLVLLSLKDKFNLSSAVIQVSWIAISVIGMVRYYVLHHRSRFTPDEKAFLDATMPGLEPIHARRLLDLGSWHTGEAATRITDHGRKNEYLYYLLTGTAHVRFEGKLIAKLQSHTFVGELTLISNAPASATVELAESCRYLALPVEPLRRLMDRDIDVSQHLKAAMSGHVVDKLVRSSKDLADLATASGTAR